MNEETSMSGRVLSSLIALAFVPLAQADEFQGMSPATPALTEKIGRASCRERVYVLV